MVLFSLFFWEKKYKKWLKLKSEVRSVPGGGVERFGRLTFTKSPVWGVCADTYFLTRETSSSEIGPGIMDSGCLEERRRSVTEAMREHINQRKCMRLCVGGGGGGEQTGGSRGPLSSFDNAAPANRGSVLLPTNDNIFTAGFSPGDANSISTFTL